MKRTLLEIYSLAVCFFVVAYLVFVCPTMIWNGVRYINPEIALGSYYFAPHRSDDAFRRYLIENHEKNPSYEPPTGEELSRTRQESYATIQIDESRAGLQQALQGLISMAVCGVVFLIHWKLASSARRAAEDASK